MAFFTQEVTDELEKGGSSFYQLEQGQNEFRIVSDFAWGYRYDYEHRALAEEQDYPFFRLDDPIVKAERDKLVLNAAMVVYDYAEGVLKNFSIHQKNILNAIRDYTENEKYGDPTGYDLVITKKGEGRETRYSVIANPPEDLSDEIEKALKSVEIKMDNVYEGENTIVEKE